MKRIVFIGCILWCLVPVSKATGEERDESFLLYRLMAGDELLARYMNEAADWDIQIIFTRIDRDKAGRVKLDKHTFRLNGNEYFNPASLVKWPLILLTMDKVNELRKENPAISLDNRIEFLGNTPCSPRIVRDPLAPDHVSRLSNYIKEMLLASDDDAYNRVYDFLGQAYINQRLSEKGYDSVRVISRFAPCSYEDNRKTPAIRMYDEKGQLVHSQPEQLNPDKLTNPLGKVMVGGRDYSLFNRLSLQDMYELMLSVFVPEVVPDHKKFHLTDSDRELLWNYTAMYPGDSEFTAFREKPAFYHRHLKKYLLYGKNPKQSDIPGLQIYNMVGESHGTVSDIAYFVNPEEGIEFMLAAVINTCGNRPVNFANSRYQEVGFPFLQRLGERVYWYCKDASLFTNGRFTIYD